MAVGGSEPRLVPFDPAAHAEGFRALVTRVLSEFGLDGSARMRPDLDDPAAAHDALWVLVADDGAVVGSVGMRLLDRAGGRGAGGGSEAELRRMYLAPDWRGRGLGRRLLETALGWAREQGVERVRLETNTGMEAARRLYEANGFERAPLLDECGSGCDRGYALTLSGAPSPLH